MKVLIADKTADICEQTLSTFPGIETDTKTGLDPQALIGEIGDYHGLVVRSATKVTREIIQAAGQLKVIGRAGAGVDNVDMAAASEKGIAVMNTPGGNASAVAELVIGLMFTLARQIVRADVTMKAGGWEKKNLMGTELAGKTLGLFGIGQVGSRVAEKASALGMTVNAYDPYVSEHKAAEIGVALVSVDFLLERSDIISLHLPKNAETENLVDLDLLHKMKKGANLINCSRGGIVVESDLVQALNEGWISAAGIDVYASEPPQDLTLVRHPQVVATPHIGASSREAQITVAEMVARQIGLFLTKGEAVNVLNKDALG